VADRLAHACKQRNPEVMVHRTLVSLHHLTQETREQTRGSVVVAVIDCRDQHDHVEVAKIGLG
jgi:hypothetical protein